MESFAAQLQGAFSELQERLRGARALHRELLQGRERAAVEEKPQWDRQIEISLRVIAVMNDALEVSQCELMKQGIEVGESVKTRQH